MSQPLSQPSTFRFVTARPDSPNDGRKRASASRACDTCRRRKKRCLHAQNSELLSSTPARATVAGKSSGVPSNTSAGSNGRQRARSGQSAGMVPPGPQGLKTSGATEEQSTRFIGDLNPEVELRSAATPVSPEQNGVGVWNEEDSVQPQPDFLDLFTSASLFHNCPEPARTAMLPVLLRQSLEVLPPSEHMRKLHSYYIENVHPILPAVDLEASTTGPIHAFQQQMMCLLVCPAPQLRDHLSLKDCHGTLNVADFSAKVLAAMRMVIELGIIQDKTLLIRGLTVMSIAATGRHNYEFSAQFFARAVHLAFTIGLHQPRDSRRDEEVSSLFCLVWSVDKMHAAIHGRPVLMHEIDMGKSAAICSQGQPPGFRTLVYISILLNKVIGLYRPGAYESEIQDADFPSFDEILLECNAAQLPTHLVATLELYYHSAAILSCRRRPTTVNEDGSTSSQHIAIITRNTRQAASAMQIQAIMNEQNTTGLVILHLVPYAVSLALGAACRDLRLSKATTQRHRARTRFEQLSQRHLRPLGEVFWSAKVMAELATKIMNDMDSSPDRANVELAQLNSSATSTVAEDLIDEDILRDFMNPEWDLGDMEGLLESNLDPSMPSLFQDMDFSYAPQ